MKYILFLVPLFFTKTAFATDTNFSHSTVNITLLVLAILLIAGKIGGGIEKKGQPSVLGELMAGIVLSALAYFGVTFLQTAKTNEILAFLAEFGAILLLFQIGLESNTAKMIKVGPSALFVALVGVIVPFVLGVGVIGPLFFPDREFTAHLFIGASLVATSVGVSASIFKSFNALKSRACQTVLGAAVIDDVLGLLILAVVSALASGQEISVGFVLILSIKALVFLVLAITIGSVFAKDISSFFSKIHTGTGMKLGLAVTFALAYAYFATLVGLAPIIGAFVAGLVLDAVDFEDFDVPLTSFKLQSLSRKYKKLGKHLEEVVHELNHRHISDMVAGIGLIFVPVFFVYTGLQIDFGTLLDVELCFVAVAVSLIAVLGKVVSGLASKGTYMEKLLVGVSMVPRGEVGLIFASVGHALGTIDTKLFSVIVLVVIITTFISPPIINVLFKKIQKTSI